MEVVDERGPLSPDAQADFANTGWPHRERMLDFQSLHKMTEQNCARIEKVELVVGEIEGRLTDWIETTKEGLEDLWIKCGAIDGEWRSFRMMRSEDSSCQKTGNQEQIHGEAEAANVEQQADHISELKAIRATVEDMQHDIEDVISAQEGKERLIKADLKTAVKQLREELQAERTKARESSEKCDKFAQRLAETERQLQAVQRRQSNTSRGDDKEELADELAATKTAVAPEHLPRLLGRQSANGRDKEAAPFDGDSLASPRCQASDRVADVPTPTQAEQQLQVDLVNEHHALLDRSLELPAPSHVLLACTNGSRPAFGRAAASPSTPRAPPRLSEDHAAPPVCQVSRSVRQVCRGGIMSEECQHIEMSLDECQRHVGTGAASPPLYRRAASLSSLTVHTPKSSLSECRIHAPQMQAQQQERLDAKQQPEALHLTPRMMGGTQPCRMQSPLWEDFSPSGMVSPVRAGAEAMRPSWQAALDGSASPRQGPRAQHISPQRLTASALAKWEAKQSPQASGGRGPVAGPVAGLTQQHSATTAGRPPPKTAAATEQGRECSLPPAVLLDQQVLLVSGRQSWPPRPAGYSSPGRSPTQAKSKSPRKIPASVLAPWQGQQSSPKRSPV